MMSNLDIEAARNAGDIEIEPFEPDCLAGSSYDIRVGEMAYYPATGKIVDLKINKKISIKPLTMIWVQSLERIKTNDSIAGIVVSKVNPSLNLTQISNPLDPNWGKKTDGKLIFPVTNLSNKIMSIEFNEKLCKIIFFRLSSKSSLDPKRTVSPLDVIHAHQRTITRRERIFSMIKEWSMKVVIPVISGYSISIGFTYGLASVFNLKIDQTILAGTIGAGAGIALIISNKLKRKVGA